MAALRQLRHADRYRPCDWDLRADLHGRAYWVDHFCRHIDVLMPHLLETNAQFSPAQQAALRTEYQQRIRDVYMRPARYEHVDILLLDQIRNEVLRKHGVEDPYHVVKQRENDAALRVLPELLGQIGATAESDRPLEIAASLLAGNLFDMGAFATTQAYEQGRLRHVELRSQYRQRPWRIDEFDAWLGDWRRRPARRVAFFIDNAGADFVLGVLPLSRWMIQGGARVTLAANTLPSLNDLTAGEVVPLLERSAAADATLQQALRGGHLRVVASGADAPLIDLTKLSDECVAALADADVVILHGMGRAMESNWSAEFSCSVLRTGTIKDEIVAGRLGASLFDALWRWTP